MNRRSWAVAILVAWVGSLGWLTRRQLFAPPEAPPLDEYLGDVGRLGIDILVAAGDTMVADGIQKWTIPCNWKFAVDNVWDWYHAEITHASALLGGWRFGEIAKDGAPARLDCSRDREACAAILEYDAGSGRDNPRSEPLVQALDEGHRHAVAVHSAEVDRPARGL